MSRIAAIVFVLPLLLPVSSVAQDAARGSPMDAVVASPDQFKVLLENDYVRVVEYVLQPGARDQWHTHPAKVSYVVQGGTLRITTADGQSFLSDEQAGTATWMGPLGRHFAQNMGQTPVRIVLTEVKGVP